MDLKFLHRDLKFKQQYNSLRDVYCRGDLFYISPLVSPIVLQASAINFFISLSWLYFSIYFSPAGWDNEKKVAILYENMHSIRPDQYYTDVIAKPIVRKSTNNRDIEVTAEDEQGFLLRQQQYLQVSKPFFSCKTFRLEKSGLG